MTPTSARLQASTAKAGAALLTQSRLTGEWLRAMTPAQFLRPVGQRGRTVRELTALMLVRATSIAMILGDATTARPVPLAAHLRTMRDWAGSDAREATGMAESGHALAHDFLVESQHIEEVLSSPVPPVVQSRYDAVRSIDLIRSQLLDIIALTDDMSAALPELGPAPIAPQARVDAARVYAELIGTLYPGRSVELRVPPATAVQLATAEGGPTHTRGTPPTVVETDPLTFLRLCNGRKEWRDALAGHHVQASGAHADLSSVFPVYAPAA